ncbi:MAG: hypothetical protein H6732_09170 [Alphaproteobacteria bacterium]|nr:hypothetical protein [Alphaproteobacteria bacterium]
MFLAGAACSAGGSDRDTDGDSDPACAGTSAARWVCEGTAPLSVGTGEEALLPLDDEGTLLLWRGTQGLQHVFVSARLAGSGALPVDRALVELRLWEPGAAEPLEEAQVFGAALWPDGDGVLVLGARYVVQDPARVVDRPLDLTVALRPVGGDVEGRGLVPVVVRWGPGQASPVADDTGAP